VGGFAASATGGTICAAVAAVTHAAHHAHAHDCVAPCPCHAMPCQRARLRVAAVKDRLGSRTFRRSRAPHDFFSLPRTSSVTVYSPEDRGVSYEGAFFSLLGKYILPASSRRLRHSAFPPHSHSRDVRARLPSPPTRVICMIVLPFPSRSLFKD
jgi:hypothetical protein